MIECSAPMKSIRPLAGVFRAALRRVLRPGVLVLAALLAVGSATPPCAGAAQPAQKKAAGNEKAAIAGDRRPSARPRAAAASAAAPAAAPGTSPIGQEQAPASEPARVWPQGQAGEAARAFAAGDVATARGIWERLAAEGDGQAMNNLGVLYDQGHGVEPDVGRALHWFARAAEAGNASGMSNYGRMLEQGRGMEANPAEAARWFDLAARKGQPEAQYNLGFLYEHGRGVPKDDAAAAAWYSRAASQRQPEALGRLGHFYRVGRGVAANPQRAVLLLYAAAMEGLPDAVEELRLMAGEGRPAAVLFGQKLDAATRAGMRAALKKAGAAVRSEDDGKICDSYDAARVVPGATEMAVCYGRGADAPLAFLKIDYPAPDRARAQAILHMVEGRFGPPSTGEGEDSRLWNLGSTVVATQYAPTHGQMSLMYMVPAVYHQTRGHQTRGQR